MKSVLYIVILFCLSVILYSDDIRVGITTKRIVLLMGSRFEIIVVDEDRKKALEGVELAQKEVERIEDLISSWKEGTQTSQINENAGVKAVKVDLELFQLIKRCIKVSEITEGVFDITFASAGKHWKFDSSMTVLPDEKILKEDIKLINYKDIILDETNLTVLLKNKGMKIGFGAIGKGYAANKVTNLLKDRGFANGIINAGGDLFAWGVQETGEPWKIQIADPDHKEKSFSSLNVSNTSVVTSGNYERFAIIDGKKYNHIIDPRTGYPCTGVKSATVICPNAELADALATTIFILGPVSGVKLIESIRGVACLIIDDDGEKYASKNLRMNFVER